MTIKVSRHLSARALIALLFLALPTSAHADQPTTIDELFDRSVSPATGASPQSVAIADLNADGRLDLVTANQGANTVSVLLGNGDGTFGFMTAFATFSAPIAVAIADLNADGRPDVVTANGGGNNGWMVSVLLGNGDGTFGPHTDISPVGPVVQATSLAIADLNTDGKPDLVVANSGAESVLLGNGDGTFGPKTDFGTGGSATIADVNTDGRPDVVTANRGNKTVSVFLGNGDGTFGPKTVFNAGEDPFTVAVADLNEDGKPDLAVANRTIESHMYQPWRTVSVLLGNGDGSFGGANAFDIGGYFGPASVAIADFDGDGSLDLATANNGASNLPAVSVLLGNGQGAFGPAMTWGQGYVMSMVTADLNADGWPDLAFTRPTSPYGVTVLLHADEVTPTVAMISPTGGESWLANTEHDITWNASDNIEVTGVDLELSTDGGVSYPMVIATGIPNTGSYAWTTPDLTTSTARIRVTANDFSHNTAQSASVSDFTIQQPLSVPSTPLAFAVSVRPNPVSGAATFEMSVARDAHVRLSLVDLQGREVQRFASGIYSAGRYPLRWDGRSNGRQTAAGLYFLRYETPDRVIVQQLAVTH